MSPKKQKAPAFVIDFVDMEDYRIDWRNCNQEIGRSTAQARQYLSYVFDSYATSFFFDPKTSSSLNSKTTISSREITQGFINFEFPLAFGSAAVTVTQRLSQSKPHPQVGHFGFLKSNQNFFGSVQRVKLEI